MHACMFEPADICSVGKSLDCGDAQVRATLSEGWGPSIKRSIGPINLQFTIPMYCASRLQVRYLQILKDRKNHQPFRWVRYVTLSNSYVVRT